MPFLRPLASRSRRALLRIRPTDPEPYATHLPVLMALARLTAVRSVLELGSGPFSTGMFLDRGAFPHLQSLTSYEDDPDWEGAIRAEVSDSRFELRMVDAVRESVPESLDEYDLIFIDDSRTVVERTQTLLSVASKVPSGIVAMHDFEQRGYRAAVRKSELSLQFVFRSFTPQVGILGVTPRISTSSLSKAAAALDAGARSGVSMTDRPLWIERLSQL